LPSTIVENYFEPETAIELVSSVHDEIESSPDLAQNSLQSRLLCGIAENNVGVYSKFHENAVYALGYDHDETLRLAHM
jgi:RNA-dependent RNA polymerase